MIPAYVGVAVLLLVIIAIGVGLVKERVAPPSVIPDSGGSTGVPEPGTAPATTAVQPVKATANPEMPMGQALCGILGVVLALIAVYYLIVAPGNPDASVLGRDVVNLQRLTIGETSGIAAAVFLAAALRPLGRR